MTLLLGNLGEVGGRALRSFLVDELYPNAMHTHLQEIGTISTSADKRQHGNWHGETQNSG